MNANDPYNNANAPVTPAFDITQSLATALASQMRALPDQTFLVNSHHTGTSSRSAYGNRGPSAGDLHRWVIASSMRQELLVVEHSYWVLRRKFGSTSRPSPEERAAVRHTEASLKVLARIQDIILASVPLNARPTNASGVKARQVFEIAELLERVLLQLDFGDLLSAQLVNTTFAHAFARSTVLQQEMGLRPLTDARPFSPLAGAFFVRRGCLVRLDDHHRFGLPLAEDELVFSASANGINPFEHQALPRLTDRYRKILVCQPPLTTMKVRTGECNKHDHGSAWTCN